MADDQNPQDRQVPVTSTDQSASSDANRPDSTIMADSIPQSVDPAIEPVSSNPSNLADTPPATSPPPSPPIQEPVSTISADLSQVLADSPSVSVSPTEPPAEVIPAPVPEEISSPDQAPISSSPVTSPDLSTPSNLSPPAGEAGNPLPINVGLPEIKPVEVQSDAPNSTPTITQSQQATESASFKPEPSESPQNAPLADSNSTNSPSTSFGDLLSDDVNPASSHPSTPSSPSPLPSSPLSPEPSPASPVSFGDLIKDIKPEESVVLPPQTPPTFPTPPSQNPQPVSPTLPPLPISPNLSVNRTKANQARIQKKVTHLQKILDLAKTKGKITNKDIRDFLRVSQSTATNYLSELVHRGSLKIEKHAKATFYSI